MYKKKNSGDNDTKEQFTIMTGKILRKKQLEKYFYYLQERVKGNPQRRSTRYRRKAGDLVDVQ